MDRLEIHRDTKLGLQPYYFHEGGSTHAPTIAGLFASTPSLSARPDREGLRQYFARQPDGRRTCFEKVSKVPLHHLLTKQGNTLALAEEETKWPALIPPSRWIESLTFAIKSILGQSRRPALALSGGLDSAFLLALCRRIEADITVVTLGASLPGYCEKETTLAAAKSLGCDDVLILEAKADDFIQALPAAIAAGETPLYNLHPVSKWLLARELRRRGFDTVITGDGADQVFAGADSRNYLPIVGAMTRAAGIALACPFLDCGMAPRAGVVGSDPDKSALRALALDLLPPEIAHRPKQPRLAPDFDLSIYRTDDHDARLSQLLGQPAPPPIAGPSNTLWATATLLYQQIGGLD